MVFRIAMGGISCLFKTLSKLFQSTRAEALDVVQKRAKCQDQLGCTASDRMATKAHGGALRRRPGTRPHPLFEDMSGVEITTEALYVERTPAVRWTFHRLTKMYTKAQYEANTSYLKATQALAVCHVGLAIRRNGSEFKDEQQKHADYGDYIQEVRGAGCPEMDRGGLCASPPCLGHGGHDGQGHHHG